MTNVQELWRNITAATLTCVILLTFADAGSFRWFIVGLTYAWFFEYFYHRCIGHTEFFPIAAEKHREHHREWRGENALSTDRAKQHLNESWYFFPAALLAHFLIPKLIFGWMPWPILIAFTLFYLQFEVFHWATHIEDNWLDNLLYGIPIVRSFRREQVNWHLWHHELPKERFNFTPPYPGDYIFGTDINWQ